MKPMDDKSVCFECVNLYGEIITDEYRLEYECEEGCPQCGMRYGCYMYEKREDDG